MWAVHTRDYRIHNPQACQILVCNVAFCRRLLLRRDPDVSFLPPKITVPHILQMMLLSPSLSKLWVPRIRYVIFDEIHSIGEEEGGAVWEVSLTRLVQPSLASHR